jgi:CRISPR-associated protein Cmx8
MAATKTTEAKKKAKSKKRKSKKATISTDPIELRYRLAELPSSQHRAGLVGLVLIIRWLEQQSCQALEECVLAITELDAGGATFRIDQKGVAVLFDEVYAAAMGETRSKTPYKDKRTKEIKTPLRIEEVEAGTDKKGNPKTQKVYIYPAVIPRGSFLASWDPSSDDGVNGLWIKLWRDTIWSIFRGVPATRRPYEERAKDNKPGDSDAAWGDLANIDAGVELPSTYYLGAQALTAENVPFKDRARYRFLLHFWHFAAAINVPTVVDNEGKSSFHGCALVVPDICNLEEYVEAYPATMQTRAPTLAAYLPKGAIVDLPAEAGLELFRLLRSRLATREGGKETADMIEGVDVFHTVKEGNNVRVLGVTRVEPIETMNDEYARLKGAYRSHLYRRQRLTNMLHERAWWHGFGALCATTSARLTIQNPYFRHDAKKAFTETETTMTDESSQAPKTIEQMIYRMVRAYLGRKLASKYDLSWEIAKTTDAKKKEYSAKREKLAREAFLAVRSRTGSDFVEYFTSTICSVPQHLAEDSYITTSKALLEETERIRTLTLLALSANG